MSEPLAALTARTAGPGRLVWIGLRPARRAPVMSVPSVRLTEVGLEGDRHPRANGRSVTLIQAEHLPVIAALAHAATPDPAELRRNLVVAGLNLLAMRGRVLSLGPEAMVVVTGPCAPCSRMEAALGPGGYTAMRGHGGVTASVARPGPIAVGDSVVPAPTDP